MRLAYSASFLRDRFRFRASHSGKGRAVEEPAMVYTGTALWFVSFMVGVYGDVDGVMGGKLSRIISSPHVEDLQATDLSPLHFHEPNARQDIPVPSFGPPRFLFNPQVSS